MNSLLSLLIAAASSVATHLLNNRQSALVESLARLAGVVFAMREKMGTPITQIEINTWKADANRRDEILKGGNDDGETSERA